MDNMNTESTAFERYVDATVGLFMEQYTKELAYALEQEPAEQMPYPAELDRRCLALIQKARKKERLRKFNAVALKALRRVAIIVVALLSLASILFVTVEAFREPIIDFFFKEKDGYWEVTGDSQSAAATDGLANMDDPLAGLLPDGYKLAELVKDEGGNVYARYLDDKNNTITLTAYSGSRITNIDSENVVTSQQCTVNGYEGILIDKDSKTQILWVSDITSKQYKLFADGLEAATLLELAEKISVNFPE